MANLHKNSLHRIRQDLLRGGHVTAKEDTVIAYDGATARTQKKQDSKQIAIQARQKMFARKGN